MADQVEEWREKLLETLAEHDDEIMEKYLEGETPTRRRSFTPRSVARPWPTS